MLKVSRNLSPKNRYNYIDKKIVAITGSIATGKTTVSNYIKKNHPLFSADELVKESYQGHKIQTFLTKHLPLSVENGSVDFSMVRSKYLNDISFQEKINTIIYNEISILLKEKIKDLSQDYFFYDIPLLVEKNLEDKFDVTICVYCPEILQVERLKNRNSSQLPLLKNQISIEYKKDKCDYVLDNSSDLNSLYKNTDHLLKELFSNV